MKKAGLWIITIFLTICFMVPSISAATIPSDVEDTGYEQAVTELLQFHIITGYEDGGFRPDSTLTRAEFSAIVIRAMGLEEATAVMGGQTLFADVPDSHWGAGYINLASQLGIINGYGEGRFGPEDEVTGAQTLKMLVCALGYQFLADQNGGYPNGYLTAARQIRLLTGVDFSLDEPISRGNAAVVVSNAMDVELLESDYGPNGASKTSGDTLMSKLCDLYDLEKRQGVVTNDGISSLNQETEIDIRRMSIDGEVYDTGMEEVQGLLGYFVTYYVKKDTDEIYSIVKGRKNEVLTIRADEVTETAETQIQYLPADSRRGTALRVNVSAGAPTVCNGRYLKDATPNDWKNESGSLNLLDNDGDGTYDVVFVNDYTNYMTSGVDGSRIKLKVFSDNGESRFLGNDYINTADSKITVRLLDTEDNVVGLSSLKQDQILSVYASRDGKYATVVPAVETISGKVQELSMDGDVVIGGKTYQLAKNKKGEYVAPVQPGDEGTFWLDVEGDVTAMHVTRPGFDVETINNEMICSYILDSDVSTGVDRTVRFKLLSNLKDGTRKENIFTLAQNVWLDGEKMTPAEAFEQLQEDGVNRPILYEINNRAEITKLYSFKPVGGTMPRIYTAENKSFDNLFYLDDKSIKYFVDAGDSGTVYDEAKVELTDGKKYQVKVYDPTDAMLKDGASFSLRNRVFVISVDMSNATRSASDAPMLVQSVSQTLDGSGDARYEIKGLVGKETVTYQLSEMQQEKVDRIQSGSLITFALDGYDEIKTFKVVAQVPSETTYRMGTGGKQERLYGRVQSVKNNSDYSSCILTLEYQSGDRTEKVAYEIAGKPIYLYSPSTQTAEPATLNDIYTSEYRGEDASEALAYAVNFDVSCIVVIK